MMLMLTGIITALNGMAQHADYSKMSMMVRDIVRQQTTNTRKCTQMKMDKRQHLCAFIRIDNDAESILAANECRSLARCGNIHIADIPIDRLSELSLLPQVQRIECNSGSNILMDSTALHINALPVYSGTGLPQAYTGDGVVVGVQDIGFDLTHPNFYDATASDYRIKRLWDMLSTDTTGSSLYVGNDYAGRETLLNYAHSRDGEKQTHGTHTLGIAAGSGYDSKYRGMAYGSDICLVANASSENMDFIDSTDYYKYTDATNALGFKYIFDYATSVGKPCVISFSEGNVQTMNKNDLLYDAMLDSLVGPGRIIVASAGNSSLRRRYIHKPAGTVSDGAFIMNKGKQFLSSLRSDNDFTLRLRLYDTSRAITDSLILSTHDIISMPDSICNDTIGIADENYAITAQAYPFYNDFTQTIYDLNIKRDNYDSQNFVSLEIIGNDADVELFCLSGYLTDNADIDPSLNAGDSTHCILSPGSALGVICAGATSYRTGFTNYLGKYIPFDQGTNGRRADYSSIGPTMDNRIKPDVMAPGTNIISSYSSFYLEHNPNASDINSDVRHFDFNGRTYAWTSDAGTSMSAPAVAGTIALWLQANPALTPDDIKSIFNRTCTHYDATLTYPNNEYGYGQIDVYRGLLDVLGLDGNDGISTHQPETVNIGVTPTGDVTIDFQSVTSQSVTVCVYATSGMLIKSEHIPSGTSSYTLRLGSVPQGVYAVQINGHGTADTGSTLIRR